ncbi:hypothetical protein [Massilia sp. S19_KUP03_FR1]|uniref:hypothetical protein n=1 Tax=Massilia sp. S19_KUP03_FR1 TaxID=3025503 RepID=UPI002FCCD174
MAEQEITKHTKNLLKTAISSHSWVHKLREILLEMLIIVFAVSISIWFHSLGEHRHEQAQVRSFLLGLKSDLQRDHAQLKEVVRFHHAADQRYASVAALDQNAAPDEKTFEEAWALLNSNNFLVVRQGRYEGFKSAGKLTNIENDTLLEQIIERYEYMAPKLALSSGGWLSEHRRLTDFSEKATADDDSLATRYRALTSSRGKLLLKHMATNPQFYERAQNLAVEDEAIIAAIDKAYPDQGTSQH